MKKLFLMLFLSWISTLLFSQNDLFDAMKRNDFKQVKYLFTNSNHLSYERDSLKNSVYYFLWENLQKDNNEQAIEIDKWLAVFVKGCSDEKVKSMYYLSKLQQMNTNSEDLTLTEAIFNQAINAERNLNDSMHLYETYYLWGRHLANEYFKGNQYKTREQINSLLNSSMNTIPSKKDIDSSNWVRSLVIFEMSRLSLNASLIDSADYYHSVSLQYLNLCSRDNEDLIINIISLEIDLHYLKKFISSSKGDSKAQILSIENAIVSYKKYFELENDQTIISNSMLNCADLHIELFNITEQNNDKLLHDALKFNQEVKPTPQLENRIFYQRAQIFHAHAYFAIKNIKYDQILGYYDSALVSNLKLNPSNVNERIETFNQRQNIYGDIALYYVSFSNPDSIIKYLDEAIMVNQLIEPLISEKSQIKNLLYQRKDLLLRRTYYQQHVKIEQYLNEANNHFNNNYFDTAINIATNALELNQNNIHNYNDEKIKNFDQRFRIFKFLGFCYAVIGSDTANRLAIDNYTHALNLLDIIINEIGFNDQNFIETLNILGELTKCYGNIWEWDDALQKNREIEELLLSNPNNILSDNDLYQHLAFTYNTRGNIYLNFHKKMKFKMDELNLARNEYYKALTIITKVSPQTEQKLINEMNLFKDMAKSFNLNTSSEEAYKMSEEKKKAFSLIAIDSALLYSGKAIKTLTLIAENFGVNTCMLIQQESELNDLGLKSNTIKASLNSDWNPVYEIIDGLLSKNNALLHKFSIAKDEQSLNCLLEQKFGLNIKKAFTKRIEFVDAMYQQTYDSKYFDGLFLQSGVFLDSARQIAEKLNSDCIWLHYHFNRADHYRIKIENPELISENYQTCFANAMNECDTAYQLILKLKDQNFGDHCLADKGLFYSFYIDLLTEQPDTEHLQQVLQTVKTDMELVFYYFLELSSNFRLFDTCFRKYLSTNNEIDKQIANKYLGNFKFFHDKYVSEYPDLYNQRTFGFIDYYDLIARYYDVNDDYKKLWDYIVLIEDAIEKFDNALQNIGYYEDNHNERRRNYKNLGVRLIPLELKIYYFMGVNNFNEVVKQQNVLEAYVRDSLFNHETYLNRQDSLNIYLKLSKSYVRLARAYYNLEDYETSIECHNKGVQFASLSESKEELYFSYISMGLALNNLRKYDEAIQTYRMANQLAKEIDTTGWDIAYTYEKLAEQCESLGHIYNAIYYDSAIYYRDRAIVFANKDESVKFHLMWNKCKLFAEIGPYESYKDSRDSLQKYFDSITFDNVIDRAEKLETLAAIFEYWSINDGNIDIDERRESLAKSSHYLQLAKDIYDSLPLVSRSNGLKWTLFGIDFMKFKLSDLMQFEIKYITDDKLNDALKDSLGLDKFLNYNITINNRILEQDIILNSKLHNISDENFGLNYGSEGYSFENMMQKSLLLVLNMMLIDDLDYEQKDSVSKVINELVYKNVLLMKKTTSDRSYRLKQVIFESGDEELVKIYEDYRNAEVNFYKYLQLGADAYNLRNFDNIQTFNEVKRKFAAIGLETRNMKEQYLDSLAQNENLLLKRLMETGLNEKFKTPDFNQLRNVLEENEVAIEFVDFTLSDQEIANWNTIDFRNNASLNNFADVFTNDTIYAVLTKKEWESPHFIPLCRKVDLWRFEYLISYHLHDKVERILSNLAGIEYIAAIDSLKKIDGTISQYLPQIINERYTGIEKFTKHSLFSLLWEPLLEYLSEDDTIIYFSPYGDLNSITFNAIKRQDGSNRFLVDDYHLIRVSSTADIIALKQDEHKKMEINEMLAFRDIDYGESSDMNDIAKIDKGRGQAGIENICGFPPYKFKDYNDYQTDSLGNLFKKSLTAQDATKENFVKSIAQNRHLQLLLIATHGYYYNCPEIDSINNVAIQEKDNNQFIDPLSKIGLVFANANIKSLPSDDYIINGAEISNLALPGNELTILAACESGLGDNLGSEGVFGFQRAFKNAGAKYVMSSLWKVDIDASNKFLSIFLKDYLGDSSDIHKSYRKAMLEMRNNEYFEGNPFYWAAYDLFR